jgi:hypothetical protein
MSRNASTRSSSYSLWQGISPLRILSKMVSAMARRFSTTERRAERRSQPLATTIASPTEHEQADEQRE